MNASRQLRSDLESALEKRIPGALSPRSFPVLPKVPCGILDIDRLLDGGLPQGAISELSGAVSSGRTTFALRVAAQVTQQIQVCAWIDASDAFDPESASANSIELDRLLWVRCGVVPPPLAAQHGPAGKSAIQPPSSQSGSTQSCNSLHPRSEAKGLDEAVGRFLDTQTSHCQSPTHQDIQWHAPMPQISRIRQAKPGTPGAPNRPLTPPPDMPARLPVQRGMQVATDRLPARRGAKLLELHKAERQDHRPSVVPTRELSPGQRKPAKSTPWSRLDQALRATDLLMQSGGFAAIILDLGGIAPQAAQRIPLATWFRFRAAADRTRTCLLLLTQVPCAQSSAEVSLHISLDRAAKGTVMTSLPIKVEIFRQRFQPTNIHHTGPFHNVTSIRKAPQRATAAGWSPPTAWAAASS